MGFEGIPQHIVQKVQEERSSDLFEQRELHEEFVEDFLQQLPPTERRSAVEAMVSELPIKDQDANRKALLTIVDAIDSIDADAQSIKVLQEELKDEDMSDFVHFEDKTPDEKAAEIQAARDALNTTQQENADKLERRLEYLRSINKENHD